MRHLWFITMGGGRGENQGRGRGPGCRHDIVGGDKWFPLNYASFMHPLPREVGATFQRRESCKINGSSTQKNVAGFSESI